MTKATAVKEAEVIVAEHVSRESRKRYGVPEMALDKPKGRSITTGWLQRALLLLVMLCVTMFLTGTIHADPVTLDSSLSEGASAISTFFTSIFGILVTVSLSLTGLGYMGLLRRKR